MGTGKLTWPAVPSAFLSILLTAFGLHETSLRSPSCGWDKFPWRKQLRGEWAYSDSRFKDIVSSSWWGSPKARSRPHPIHREHRDTRTPNAAQQDFWPDKISDPSRTEVPHCTFPPQLHKQDNPPRHGQGSVSQTSLDSVQLTLLTTMLVLTANKNDLYKGQTQEAESAENAETTQIH